MTKRHAEAPRRREPVTAVPTISALPGEPGLRVLVTVAHPRHGASDRARLGSLIAPLGDLGISLRPWTQPRLAAPGEPRSVDDAAAVLWADVIWVRRFANPLIPDTEDGTFVPSGFGELLEAIAEDPWLLRGRRVVYDLDADLLSPRSGTLAEGVLAVDGQVDTLLSIADLVTVATPTLAELVARRVAGDRVRVLPTAIAAGDYAVTTRDPRRLPVVACIDGLDGPGGIEGWLPELMSTRERSASFRLVRLVDPSAPAIVGFDEIITADEGSADWVAALVELAPDIVLAPSTGDRFAAAASPLPWLEASAVGAATIAAGGPGPYRGLRDGRDVLLVASAREAAAALGDLLRTPARREALATAALVRLGETAAAADVARSWAEAFHVAASAAPRSGSREPADSLARRAGRRNAIARAAAAPSRPARRVGSSLALVGTIPADAGSLLAACKAACRMTPQPKEIVLAGTAAAVASLGPVLRRVNGGDHPIRTVGVPEGTSAGGSLARAIATTSAAWLGFLDASAELRPGGLAELIDVVRENDLDAAFGELAELVGPEGARRVGGWPPSEGTFRASALVIAGEVARGPLPPGAAELDDPVLDWLLALMETGCRTGSAGIIVARSLPPAARALDLRSVGAGVPYADGGEDRLMGIIAGASDRRAASDELAAHITDWTSRYHLSRLRGNIVASVDFPPGSRVIDVGAGTGTIARALGERGLEVVALEGSLDRARVAAVRCADLPGVEVVHATVGDYDEPGAFDAVVVIGVLEYSGSFAGGAAGPAAFLGRVKRLLKPGGVLVLAIENRFGLKYLQGYAEDHLARPWVGVDGYAGTRGVRTWSRRALGALVADAGLPHQRWRYPFPDYKLPMLVLDERAYRQPDADVLVDALVREPVKDYSNPRTLLRDDRGAHLGMLEAGLGEDVANSFLVIASADPAALDRVAPGDGPLAWLFGDERAARWLRRRTLIDEGGGRFLTLAGPPTIVGDGPLQQVRTRREPFVAAQTLEQELKAALGADDLGAVRRLLHDWISAIDAEGDAIAAGPEVTRSDADAAGPFAPVGREAALPGVLLDLVPANFVRAGDGMLVRVDREWQLTGRIDRGIALFRALWHFADGAVRGAWGTPWPPDTSVRTMTHELALLAGVADDDALIERSRIAEGWLQNQVHRGGGGVGAQRTIPVPDDPVRIPVAAPRASVR